MVKKRINSPKGSNADRREEGKVEPKTSGTVSDRKFAYEIRLKNHLNQRWAEWFDGWTITNVEDDEVILVCTSTDHARLHGALDKIRDLNLTLISVKRISLDLPGSGENLEQDESQAVGRTK